MFIEKIKTNGIAHLSYVIGDGASAAVIDPQRDVDVYCRIASKHGAAIEYIFETHRNEDFVIGSIPLADRTGATILHGKGLDFGYGRAVKAGDRFQTGDLELKVLETPGHTMESISIVVTDLAYDAAVVGVFTGDALFVGEVGRTDFFPDRAEEVAGMLYDSIQDNLLPLGDQAIIWPAHGAGSVCGSGMASREFSTIGQERLTNPALQESDRDAFIARKTGEIHYQPPYFRKMEEYNLNGSPELHHVPGDVPLSSQAVERAVKDDDAVLLDLRSPEAIAGAFIPGALAIPAGMLSAYGGWFLDYDRDLILVPETRDQMISARKQLIRMGYDRITGYLDGGMHAWETSGRTYERIPAIHARELMEALDASTEKPLVLDVRKHAEFDAGHLPGARHIYLGYLPDELDNLPRDRTIITFCGSGQRAIIAASILRQHGFESVQDCLGSMQACKALGCNIEKGGEK